MTIKMCIHQQNYIVSKIEQKLRYIGHDCIGFKKKWVIIL